MQISPNGPGDKPVEGIHFDMLPSELLSFERDLRLEPTEHGKLRLIRDKAAALICKGFARGRIADHLTEWGAANDLDQEAIESAICDGIERGETAKARAEQPDLRPNSRELLPSLGSPVADFTPIHLDAIELEDEPAHLIPGLLPVGPALHVLFGPPKSLKSFVLMYVYLCIAAGIDYCDRKVQQGVVVYVTNEGVRGVKRRLIAMRRHLGIEGKGVPFYLVQVMPNLGAGHDDATKLIAQIKKAVPPGTTVQAIAIDTLRRAIPGKDENATKDLSVFIQNCGLIAQAFSCLTSAVHHSPRSDDTRSSGSNSLDAAADCMWGASRDGNNVTTTVHRMKDGPEDDAWTCSLRVMEIGTDKDGQPITSCSLDIIAMPEGRSSRKPEKITQTAQRYLDSLHNVMTNSDTSMIDGRRAASTKSWQAEATRLGLIDIAAKPNSARSLFSKYRAALVTAHRIGCKDDWSWPVS